MTPKQYPPRVAFITFGCRSNQYDTSVMMAGLDPERFEIVEAGQGSNRTASRNPADIYVINTCTVTHKSDFQARQMIRRVKKWNPEARVIVTGCLVETNPASLKGLPYDHLVRPAEMENVPRIIENGSSSAQQGAAGFYHDAGGGMQPRTRAVVKVQDGCDCFCSYCIVPFARGRSRSLEPQKVIRQLEALHDRGFMEAVLTGINLGSYGRDIGVSLTGLLELIESEKKIPARIRISSIEPQEISGDLIGLISASKRICPHLHLPLQSGDDRVLARMGRAYTSREFSDFIRDLHANIPGLCLGMDVMAGFPGETDQEFDNTMRLLEGMRFAYLHVFPFSPRPGTRAAEFEDPVPPRKTKARTAALRRLGEDRRAEFYASHEGKTMMVLFERRRAGFLRGLSGNYIPVRAQGPGELAGKLVSVKAENSTSKGIEGKILY